MIYADNAATTKLDIEVFEEMKRFFLEEYGNASQPYSFSRITRKALSNSRKKIADCIGASPNEIYFTSGGTESNNWALKGVMEHGIKNLIITSQIEHHSILNTCHFIEHTGNSVKYLPVDNFGIVSPLDLDKSIKDSIKDSVKIVSIMLANNEIGTIEPIKELCDITHKKDVLFHTDAVQAVGHIPINVNELGIDMLSASAHKFNGPKGVGFIYIRNGTKIRPFNDGGSQEFGMRAGTENIPGIVGMAHALKNNCDLLEKNAMHLSELEKILIEKLKLANIDFIRNGHNQLPGSISLSFRNIEGEMLLHRLDLKGISISTGSACDSKNTKATHVIEAINVPKEYKLGTIRITLGKNNTVDDVSFIADAIISILKNLFV
jgi:cysteine desulfurase